MSKLSLPRKEKVEIGIISIAFGLAILGFAAFVISKKKEMRVKGRSGNKWLLKPNPNDNSQTDLFAADFNDLYILTYKGSPVALPTLINSSAVAGQALVMAAISDFSIVARPS